MDLEAAGIGYTAYYGGPNLMDTSIPTDEWAALKEVWKLKKEIIRDRWQEHHQHIIEHGSPRVRPDKFLAAIIVMKALRIWSNLENGGSAVSLQDSALDLSNYADFFAAFNIDEREKYMKTISCTEELEN